MDGFTIWRDFFRNWPQDVPRRGVVVTAFNDQIPFMAFLCSDTLLILERVAPDALGGRRVLLSYHMIEALKFTDVVKIKPFQDMGFVGTLPKT